MIGYLKIQKNEDYEKIIEPAKCIKGGGLVLFPTETVYGIGANGLDENAVKKIYEVKGRKTDNPLILHISSLDMVDKLAKNITDIEYKLMDAFWPGPFTIILPKKDIVPSIVTGGLDTVAIRMPSNKIANTLIKYAGVPIAAPSANISGKPSGTCVEDIYGELVDKVDYIIDGGQSDIGLESTVVKVENGTAVILRPGKITKEQIEQVIDSVILDKHIFGNIEEGEKVLSPGMKYKHYAPKTKCELVYNEDNGEMVNMVLDVASKYAKPCIICCEENSTEYSNYEVLVYGRKNDLDEISKNIFTLLRKTDAICADIVLIEGVEKEGIGLAIMNRLTRACFG